MEEEYRFESNRAPARALTFLVKGGLIRRLKLLSGYPDLPDSKAVAALVLDLHAALQAKDSAAAKSILLDGCLEFEHPSVKTNVNCASTTAWDETLHFYKLQVGIWGVPRTVRTSFPPPSP
jgi:hypothetical protein